MLLLFFTLVSCHSSLYFRNALSVAQLVREPGLCDKLRLQLYSSYQDMTREASPNAKLSEIVQEKYRNFLMNTVANLDRMNIKRWLEDMSANSVMDWQCKNDRSKLPIDFPQEVLELLKVDRKELSRCASLATYSNRTSCYMSLLQGSLPIMQALYVHNALSAYQQLKYLEFDYGLPDITTFLNTTGLNRRLLMMKIMMMQMNVLDYFTTFPLVASVFYGLEYLRHLAYLSGNMKWLANMQETAEQFESEVLAELVPHIYPLMVRVVYEEKLAKPLSPMNIVGVRIRAIPCTVLVSDIRTMKMVPVGRDGGNIMEMTIPILHGTKLDIQWEIMYVKRHCLKYCL